MTTTQPPASTESFSVSTESTDDSESSSETHQHPQTPQETDQLLNLAQKLEQIGTALHEQFYNMPKIEDNLLAEVIEDEHVRVYMKNVLDLSKSMADFIDKQINCQKLVQAKMSDKVMMMQNALVEAHEAEKQWMELNKLFQQYKDKVDMEMGKMKGIMGQYEEVNAGLTGENERLKGELSAIKQEYFIVRDIMIRQKANEFRRANLEQIQGEIEAEDVKIKELIRKLGN